MVRERGYGGGAWRTEEGRGYVIKHHVDLGVDQRIRRIQVREAMIRSQVRAPLG